MQAWQMRKPQRQDQQKGNTFLQQWQVTARPRRCFLR